MNNIIKTSILTLVFLSLTNFAAFSMMSNEEKGTNTTRATPSVRAEEQAPPIKKSRVTLEDAGFDDNPITLDENAPVVLISKDYQAFDKTNKLLPNADGSITCITSSAKSHIFELETPRFFVKEGDKIKISYKIEIHPGGNVLLGLLNSKRNGWFGSKFVSLSPGAAPAKGIFKRITPEGETETSLVLSIAGTQETPCHSSFTVKSIKIKKM